MWYEICLVSSIIILVCIILSQCYCIRQWTVAVLYNIHVYLYRRDVYTYKRTQPQPNRTAKGQVPVQKTQFSCDAQLGNIMISVSDFPCTRSLYSGCPASKDLLYYCDTMDYNVVVFTFGKHYVFSYSRFIIINLQRDISLCYNNMYTRIFVLYDINLT